MNIGIVGLSHQGLVYSSFLAKNNLNIITSQIDFGVAIIQISENKKLLKLDINNFSKLKFKDYYYNYKEFMNILDYEETLNKI